MNNNYDELCCDPSITTLKQLFMINDDLQNLDTYVPQSSNISYQVNLIRKT